MATGLRKKPRYGDLRFITRVVFDEQHSMGAVLV